MLTFTLRSCKSFKYTGDDNHSRKHITLTTADQTRTSLTNTAYVGVRIKKKLATSRCQIPSERAWAQPYGVTWYFQVRRHTVNKDRHQLTSRVEEPHEKHVPKSLKREINEQNLHEKFESQNDGMYFHTSASPSAFKPLNNVWRSILKNMKILIKWSAGALIMCLLLHELMLIHPYCNELFYNHTISTL